MDRAEQNHLMGKLSIQAGISLARKEIISSVSHSISKVSHTCGESLLVMIVLLLVLQSGKLQFKLAIRLTTEPLGHL